MDSSAALLACFSRPVPSHLPQTLIFRTIKTITEPISTRFGRLAASPSWKLPGHCADPSKIINFDDYRPGLLEEQDLL